MTIADSRIEYAVAAARQILGWCSEDELRWLAEQATRCDLIIEVGSWLGRSTMAMAACVPPGGKLICVDTWAGSEEDPGPDEHGVWPLKGTRQFSPEGIWTRFNDNLFEFIENNTVVPLRMTSREAARLFRNGVADLLFLDGSHTELAVREDIQHWQYKVTSRGVFVAHDYFADGAVCPGVKAAVESLLPEFKREVDSIVTWRSPWCG